MEVQVKVKAHLQRLEEDARQFWLRFVKGAKVSKASSSVPPNNSIFGRGDYALQDGTLLWAAKFYAAVLEAAGEMENVRCGILWGTDYFLKAADREKVCPGPD
ncbi:hypothetical protein ACET3Z_004985 [Daucus carota]